MRRGVKGVILGSGFALGFSLLLQLGALRAGAGSGCVAFAHTQLSDGNSKAVGGVTVTISSVDVYRGQVVGGTFEATGGGITSITLISGHQSQTTTYDPPATSGDFFSPFEKGPGNPRGLSEVDFCAAGTTPPPTTPTTAGHTRGGNTSGNGQTSGNGGGGQVSSTDVPEAPPANALTGIAPFTG